MRYQFITTTQYQNLEHWQSQMLISDWNSHSLLMEMQNSMATLKDNLPVYYKIKHTLTIWSGDLVFIRVYWKLTSTQKSGHVYRSFICNCQSLKQRWCPSVDKVHPDNKVLISTGIDFLKKLKDPDSYFSCLLVMSSSVILASQTQSAQILNHHISFLVFFSLLNIPLAESHILFKIWCKYYSLLKVSDHVSKIG